MSREPRPPRTQTFEGVGGRRVRVQLKINVYHVPAEDEPLDARTPENRRISFTVTALDADAPRDTSFASAGIQCYHGPIWDDALDALLRAAGPVELPERVLAWTRALPDKHRKEIHFRAR